MQSELGVKSESNIKSVFELLKKHKINDLCLPDKPQFIENLSLAKGLLTYDYELKFTLNFAVSNYIESQTDLYKIFDKFIADSNLVGINHFLILSGSHRKEIDSLILLSKIAGNYQNSYFYCAYNPYFEGQELETENLRLIKKLNTGMICGVYLQIGDSIDKLKSGLEFLYSLNAGLKIFGCLIIPNSWVLNSFRFRPWKGVYLSNQYLQNIEFADQKTIEILKIYREFRVIPLVEIIPFNDKNIIKFKSQYANL